jgi:hypothetical protein
MRPSPKILSAVLEDLAEYWRNQAILAIPEKTGDAMAVAQANGVLLPPDFVQLYQCSNGMHPKRYCDTDEKGFCFLAAEELRTEQRELVVDSMTGITVLSTDVTVFVDYMQWSWQYAFIPGAAGDGYQIGIMATSTNFKVITSSLATFLSLYMEDAQVLYDYGHL